MNVSSDQGVTWDVVSLNAKQTLELTNSCLVNTNEELHELELPNLDNQK